jgi:hypothetical protein
VLTSRFLHDLPVSLRGRGDSTSQTLRAAKELGVATHAQAVHAFTDAMAAGFRVVAVIVLLAAGIVHRGLRHEGGSR